MKKKNPPPSPGRKSHRMKGWDYSSPGWYFLTVTTKNMKSVFGNVVNGRMTLNAAGIVADACLREIPRHFPRAILDEFVVMPNHVHGLIRLLPKEEREPLRLEAFGKPVAGSIPTIMRSYKAAVTRELGVSHWQGRFWDVMARDESAIANIRQYIRNNPENFEIVMNGEPRYLGDETLLNKPKVGFLASRGGEDPHGRLPLERGEVVISGFLSPMERAVLNATLRHGRSAVWIRAWGLQEAVDSPPLRQAMEEGRLLVVSPFDLDIEAPNARRALWCNQYVLAHCDRLVIGHLNPDGMLACVLSETDPDLEIFHLPTQTQFNPFKQEAP